jgi:hypothetical protein
MDQQLIKQFRNLPIDIVVLIIKYTGSMSFYNGKFVDRIQNIEKMYETINMSIKINRIEMKPYWIKIQKTNKNKMWIIYIILSDIFDQIKICTYVHEKTYQHPFTIINHKIIHQINSIRMQGV